MKNKISIIIVFVVLTILTIFVGNKTFLGTSFSVKNSEGEKIKIPIPAFSYYVDTKSENVFYTIRGTNKIRAILAKYVESLESCYDESYFYDADLDITIFKYYVEDEAPFNKIYLDYQLGNYCKNEYILDEDWATEFKENAKVSEIKLENCISGKCSEIDVDKIKLDNLINYLINADRTKFSGNVNDSTFPIVKVYYTMNKKSYVMNIFKYLSFLGVKIIDQNDHQKNAIYELNDYTNKLLENIYLN